MCQFQVHPEIISCTLPPPTMIAFCFLLFFNDNDSKQLMTEAVTAQDRCLQIQTAFTCQCQPKPILV